jgi:hypothetical protein
MAGRNNGQREKPPQRRQTPFLAVPYASWRSCCEGRTACILWEAWRKRGPPLSWAAAAHCAPRMACVHACMVERVQVAWTKAHPLGWGGGSPGRAVCAHATVRGGRPMHAPDNRGCPCPCSCKRTRRRGCRAMRLLNKLPVRGGCACSCPPWPRPGPRSPALPCPAPPYACEPGPSSPLTPPWTETFQKPRRAPRCGAGTGELASSPAMWLRDRSGSARQGPPHTHTLKKWSAPRG